MVCVQRNLITDHDFDLSYFIKPKNNSTYSNVLMERELLVKILR